MTSLIEDIANKVYNDPYLKSLLCILEKDYVNNLNQINKKWSLNNKQYKDLIRFIDILSRSKTPENKNLAIKTISLLIDFPIINDDFFKLLIVNSFVKLGNFPSLQILDNFQDCFYFRELREDYNIKNITNQSPLKHIFTDSQKQLFDELINSNHYSFSSNTSFGKTFVLTAFIKHIIENKKNENNGDNIALMVPTKALIHQLFKSINEILKDFPNNYKAIISPKIPKYFLNNKNNYIFIFTPERLISFFAENNNPPIKYLFVDEAHKLLSNNDTRSVLIYHAITMANSKDIKIYFSSPNIHNADIFLKIINKNQNFNKYIEESPVTQNKFFIDTTTNDSYMLSDFQENIKIDNLHFKHGNNPIQNLYDLINFISFKNSQSIVYCNTPRNAMEYSTKYAELLSDIKNEEIKETIKFIKENIHKSYFLIQCLKKGIAYYFGNMPEELKIQIEYLYNKGVINLLFCTSTLLEGVNLPVKNIFILNEKIGRRRFQKIDFWNLAGRAGRLGKELSGNIFCVRLDKKYWKKNAKELLNKNIEKQDFELFSSKNKLYNNLGKILNNEKVNLKPNELERLNAYANVMFYHETMSIDSLLKNNFIKTNQNNETKLQEYKNNYTTIKDIVAKNININIQTQIKIFNNNLTPIPNEISYKACLELLNIIHTKYNLKNITEPQLSYYALMMYKWIDSQPLHEIINSSITYYEQNHKQIKIEYDKYENFNKNNPLHVNILIENIIHCIEQTIKFDLKNHISNYQEFLTFKGYQINLDWASFIEYGSCDKTLIELQELGFSRNIANFLKKYHLNKFLETNGVIDDFNEIDLKNSIDKKQHKNEYNEIADFLNWEKI